MINVCKICGEPVDLAVERHKDGGKPIHEMCYIKCLVGDIIPGAAGGSPPQTPLT